MSELIDLAIACEKPIAVERHFDGKVEEETHNISLFYIYQQIVCVFCLYNMLPKWAEKKKIFENTYKQISEHFYDIFSEILRLTLVLWVRIVWEIRLQSGCKK